MNNLYKTIEELCRIRNISIAEMCRGAGVRQTNISDLKNGRQNGLSAKNLDKIATYFGVSVSYLLGTETEKAHAEDGEDLAGYLQDLREHPETRALLEASRGMTKEQVEQMAAFAKALRGGG